MKYAAASTGDRTIHVAALVNQSSASITVSSANFQLQPADDVSTFAFNTVSLIASAEDSIRLSDTNTITVAIATAIGVQPVADLSASAGLETCSI